MISHRLEVAAKVTGAICVGLLAGAFAFVLLIILEQCGA